MNPKEKKLRDKRVAHREQQIKHAISRAKERYNLELTELDIKDIGRFIHNNKFIKEDFTIGTNRRIFIEYGGVKAWVVYSNQTNSVVTFLPPENTRLTFNTCPHLQTH